MTEQQPDGSRGSLDDKQESGAILLYAAAALALIAIGLAFAAGGAA